MSLFVSNQRFRRKIGSHFALALALAAGSAMVATGFAEPAFAKERKKEKVSAQYSKEFVAAFVPIDEAMKSESPDFAVIKSQMPAIKALAVSPDEQFVTGNLIYNVGARSQDQSYQLDGMKIMLASGKVSPEQVGQFNFVAYQLLTLAGKHSEARPHLQKAMDANYTSASMTSDQLRVNMAESYFSENRFAEGLDYLSAAIAERKAEGLQVDEQWYRRGLTVAYNNEIKPQVYDFVASWVNAFPGTENWRDAINITRNLNAFEAPEMLDLLRLSFAVDSLREKVEFIDYIEVADPRRLPREVEKVIQHGYATGRVSKDDIYVADSLRTATGRIQADRAELPALERDARAPNAALRTVVAAGDTFLNYDQPEKAEEFYTKALNLPGADRQMLLTRIGISQAKQDRYDDAIATFGQVQGQRSPIAKLWIAYAKEETSVDAEPAAEVPVES